MQMITRHLLAIFISPMKNPAAETAGYLNVRNCFLIFAR